jgi:hypothetical protein
MLGTGEYLHFIRELGERTSAPTLPVSGSAQYVFHGGTSPSDNLPGADTSVTPATGDITLDADFTNMQVQTSISVTVNDNAWAGSGRGSINAGAVFGGSLNSITVNESSGGDGAFSGFFTNFSPSAAPGGAGMSWFMRATVDGTPTTISGATALERN